MANCPNCGQRTSRTEDWACPWCGYPLLSPAYRKIPKTYKQLKEEKLPEPKPPAPEPEAVTEPEPMSEPAAEPGLTPVPELAPEPETEELVELETESVPESVPELESTGETAAEPEPVSSAEPTTEPAPAPEPEPEAEPAPTPEVAPEATAEAEATPEPATAPETEALAEPEAAPAPEPEPKPEPETVAEAKPEVTAEVIEVTVEELLSAYETDGAAADARFTSKTLKVTGTVDRVEVKDTLGIYYMTLTTTETNILQDVRCTFSRQYEDELSRLTRGQTVTVLGKYDGSIIDISLRDCVLVS